MFDYLEGVGFAHIRNSGGEYPHTRVNGSQIDHIFGSKDFMSKVLVADAFQVHTVSPSERSDYRKALSDHFPVTVDVKVQDDSDFTLQQALATTDQATRERRLTTLQPMLVDQAARSFAVDGDLPDDEDDGEFIVEGEVVEVESVLAPARAQRSAPRSGLQPFATPQTRSAPSLGTADPTENSKALSGISIALGVIQNEISTIVENDDFSTEDKRRLKELLAAQKLLVDQLTKHYKP